MAIESPRPIPLWKRMKLEKATPTTLLLSAYMVTPPVRIGDLAEHLGVVVHQVPDPGWSGALTVHDDHAVIWVNMGESLERRRFTVAHELGHLMLHDTHKAFRDVTYNGSEQESEANRYAADLLMPMWMLGPLTPIVKDDEGVARLAEVFGVSKGAMERRILESFGVPVAPL